MQADEEAQEPDVPLDMHQEEAVQVADSDDGNMADQTDEHQLTGQDGEEEENALQQDDDEDQLSAQGKNMPHNNASDLHACMHVTLFHLNRALYILLERWLC